LCAELRRGKLAAELLARLRSDHAARKPVVWSVSIEAEPPSSALPANVAEQTLLGEFLRTVQFYLDHDEEPLEFAHYLPARESAGTIASAVEFDSVEERRRVLEEVARLGAELLAPGEPKP
jgi:hypothetical protein